MRAFLATVAIGLLAGLALSGCGSSAQPVGASTSADRPRVPDSGSNRHIIYFAERDAQVMLERMFPEGPGRLHDIAMFRQMPARRTILKVEHRVGRVTAAEFDGMTPKQIADRLIRAINRTCTKRMPCKSHIVAIDDINEGFRGAGGTRLLKAMRMLDRPSPWGTTYAKRVMMYVPIQMMDGLRDDPTRWRNAARAVAMGESYWLEMYKSVGKGRMGDLDYEAWTTGVRRTMASIIQAGGHVDRAHFIIGPDTGPIEGAPASMCRDGIGCAWKAIVANRLNNRISLNGYGFYRFDRAAVKALCHRSAKDGALEGAEDVHEVLITACTRWLGKRAKGRKVA